VTGVPNYTETDTVTASGTSDDGEPVSGQASATVTLIVPTAVEVNSFTARWTTGGARLEWMVLSDSKTVEINVYRSVDPAQYGKQISPAALTPRDAGDASAVYNWTDVDVQPDQSVYYWLQVMDNGNTVWVGPASPAWAATLRLPWIAR
jgi:hypothetical protein